MSYPIRFGVMDSSGALGSYFGTGADGDVTISSNTSLTVLNKSGAYDGDMVVRNYNSLTINSGVTLTTDQPCRGLLIYVKNNCTITGTLSMTGRGAYANPSSSGASDGQAVDSNGLRFPFRTLDGTDSITVSQSLLNGCGTAAKSAIENHGGANKVLSIPRVGAAGGPTLFEGSNANGNPGSNGTGGQTGGGGGGGVRNNQSGAGAAGTCFSGGSGGGGGHYQPGAQPDAATGFGGPGGVGANGTGVNEAGGGGAGNPGGFGGYSPGSGSGKGNDANSKGQDGTGGIIVLVVGGTLTINGSIVANGRNGGTGLSGYAAFAGGGASGGGSIILAYKSISNSGTVQAIGGTGGPHKSWTPSDGGNGGSGSVQLLQVI